MASEQINTEQRRGTGFSVLAARKMEQEPNNAGGEGGEWKISSLIEVEKEVIITNNNLMFHFSGHNNHLVF